MSEPILNVYRHLCQLSENDVLISPRELQMMALCTLSFCQRHPEAQPADVARYIAFHLAKDLVPKEHQEVFYQHYASNQEFMGSVYGCASHEDYLITPTRQVLHHWLNTFIEVREDKLEGLAESQRYGGLGGLVLEGEPGVGKSELVTACLVSRGYHELHDCEHPLTDKKSFYRMPVSMGLEEKERLLRYAFNEGAVVIVDELNSSPMMERLLNALLMGITPEGTRPKNPGFLLIGTQNPASMAGRRVMSTALKRRMLHLDVAPYSTQEMMDIIQSKGLDYHNANLLVQSYQQQREIAQTNHLNPVPTFRDLLRIVKGILKARKQYAPFTKQFDVILSGLKQKIGEEQHHSSKKAFKAAQNLLTNLAHIKDQYTVYFDIAKKFDKKWLFRNSRGMRRFSSNKLRVAA